MINNKIEELLNTILESEEYIKYKEIGNILSSDSFVMNLIEEIKKLQKEAVHLEYNNNPLYLEKDKEIEKKVNILNNNKTYMEYLEKMKEFNLLLTDSKNLLDDYINSVV